MKEFISKYLREEKGFTLIEIIVTVIIVGVSIGVISIGIGIVTDSRTKGAAKNFETDLKTIRNTSITYYEKQYYIRWNYSDTAGYSYDIMDSVPEPDVSLRHIEIGKNIYIEIQYSSTESAVELSDLIESDSDKTSIRFNNNGSIRGFNDIEGTDIGGGTYIFKRNADDTNSFQVSITKKIGGIFFEQK